MLQQIFVINCYPCPQFKFQNKADKFFQQAGLLQFVLYLE